jgi:hypothetical protein
MMWTMRKAAVVALLLVGVGAVAWAAGPDWLEVSSQDGQRNWYVPEGWTVAKGVDEEVGDELIYEAPNAEGHYLVAGYGKSRRYTCPGVVESATKGGKGRAVKGVICAEGKDGEMKISACAREDKGGYIELLVVTAKPKLWSALGGTSKLRELTAKTYGIAPRGDDK